MVDFVGGGVVLQPMAVALVLWYMVVVVFVVVVAVTSVRGVVVVIEIVNESASIVSRFEVKHRVGASSVHFQRQSGASLLLPLIMSVSSGQQQRPVLLM